MVSAFDAPSEWKGLESLYRQHLASVSPVRAVLEVGVDYGFSLFTLARDFPNAIVIGVDRYWNDCGHPDAEQWVMRWLPAFPNVVIIKETTETAAEIICRKFDIIHIDAIHDMANMIGDFNRWSPKLNLGGCMMFHDVNDRVLFPEAKAFFEQLPGEKALIEPHHGLGFWYKR
jgi:predicted O-methyltransferase YrrM